jgi:hypothetical protein
MFFKNNNHFLNLRREYNKVGTLTWENDDLLMSSLNISRSFFTDSSLQQCKPEPKELEVYALLSGLPFSYKIINKITTVQQDISNVLGDSLHYWVLPDNFGVEYCVFKWPGDVWNEQWLTQIEQELSTLTFKPFMFTIYGIQINPDGCVIAKGYDEMGTIIKIREHLKTKLPFLPKKQSGWAHIPIGRILEPIGSKYFTELEHLISKISDLFIVGDAITSIKLVHERRWYMKEKTILSVINLN